MAKEKINDEILDMISGGVLKEGWETTLTSMMSLYKGKFGEDGKQMIRDLMVISLKDPTSPIEPEDLDTIYRFIDTNWDSIPAIKLR